MSPTPGEGTQALPFPSLLQALRDGDAVAWTGVLERLLPQATEQIHRAFGTEVAQPENAGGQAVASACRTLIRNIQAGRFQLNDWNDLTALFIRIATNKCLDRLHEDERLLTNVRFVPGAGGAGEVPEPLSPARSPIEETVHAEALKEIQRVVDLIQRRLKRVDRRYCEVFRLRLEGRSNRQIAGMLHWSESSVKRAWTYGVKLLRTMLDPSIVADLSD